MSAPYYQDEALTFHLGDTLRLLQADNLGYPFELGYGTSRLFPDNSVDAVVTDPPYGIGFMGHEWDQPGEYGATRKNGIAQPLHRRDREPGFAKANSAGIAGSYDLSRSANARFGEWCQVWATECLRILKPGGHLVSFGGSRTWHRLACAVEDAGFEIRDSIAWLYGSGFPKSLNVGDGRGTALKPAFEPIVVGRKPLIGTVATNLAAHGTGALNIDACRVGDEERTNIAGGPSSLQRVSRVAQGYRDTLTASVGASTTVAGRWPTNVALDEATAADLDRQTGVLNSGTMRAGTERQARVGGTIYGADTRNFVPADTYGDSGGASRFFPTFHYEAKAPKSERPIGDDGEAHPTVKPLDLMRWLVRLITPPGGTVLEPFLGSGTTAEACVIEGLRCIGIERAETYMKLAVTRVSKPIQIDLLGSIA